MPAESRPWHGVQCPPAPPALGSRSVTAEQDADLLSPAARKAAGKHALPYLTDDPGTMATGWAGEQEVCHPVGGSNLHDHQWERRIRVRSARKEGRTTFLLTPPAV